MLFPSWSRLIHTMILVCDSWNVRCRYLSPSFVVSFLTLKHVDRPAVLLAVVTNLLDARSDVEVQRLWITASQEMVRFYRERNEVF